MSVLGPGSHNGRRVVAERITVRRKLTLCFVLFAGSYMEFLFVASKMLKRPGMALMNVGLNKGTFFLH